MIMKHLLARFAWVVLVSAALAVPASAQPASREPSDGVTVVTGESVAVPPGYVIGQTTC